MDHLQNACFTPSSGETDAAKSYDQDHDKLPGSTTEISNSAASTRSIMSASPVQVVEQMEEDLEVLSSKLEEIVSPEIACRGNTLSMDPAEPISHGNAKPLLLNTKMNSLFCSVMTNKVNICL